MLRLACLLGLASVAAADTGTLPGPAIVLVENPVPTGARVSSLNRSQSGPIWVAWSEGESLTVAAFNHATHRWSHPRIAVLAAGKGPPSVAAHRADVCVVWEDSAGVQGVLSVDEGSHWGPPIRLDLDGHRPVVAALEDGRFEVAWLKSDRGRTAIATCSLSQAGTVSAPIQAAPDACAEAALALAPLQDGGALLAYRSLTEEHGVDPRLVRLRHGGWSEEHLMGSDGWRSLDEPAVGASLAVDGGRVAASWYCGADNDPRALVSGSPDAGERFLMPLTLDSPVAEQTPAVAILHDGALLSAWAGQGGSDGLWIRRATPDFALQPSVRLGDCHGTLSSLSMAVVRDYSGGRFPAELLILASWNGGNPPSAYLVEIPEAEILAASDPNCHCMPTPAELVGYPVRGRVVSKTATTVTFTHPELPGVMDQGTIECLADPAFLSSLDTGFAFLGRIERRAGQWRLYDIRILVEQPDSALPAKGF